MLAIVLLGICLLIGIVFLARWFVQTEPKDILKTFRYVAVIVGILIVIFAALLRDFRLLFFLAFVGLPWLMRARNMATMAKNAMGPSPGESSEVETRFLRMTLDHDSGELSGEVREGRFAGRVLEQMDETEMVQLWRECAAEDEASGAVLEAYLDRRFGPDWREAAAAGEPGGSKPGAGGMGSGAMSKEEAYSILGLKPGADEHEIEQAYRRMMMKLHPDQGGSDYLAAKINQAKDFLLGG